VSFVDETRIEARYRGWMHEISAFRPLVSI
jgi:hypothetical protein